MILFILVMSLFEVANYICNTPAAIAFLRERHVLRSIPPNCNKCDRVMTEVKKSDVNDGIVFRCPTHKGQKVSIRKGSFLENSHLTLPQFICICYVWSANIPIQAASEMTSLSHVTIIDWYNFLRNVCTEYLKRNPFSIGGPGRVVELDETVVSRRKYHVGRLVKERWLFGGYDRTTKMSFLILVDNRSSNTLLPLIQEFVCPGSEIHTDCWAAYNGIRDIQVNPPYSHLRVNHSENFTDPLTGACTNHIEVLWKHAKKKLKMVNGSSENLMPSYLDEFSWRQLRGKKQSDAFNNILVDISLWYVVPH
jgi:transposase-like protein